MQAGSRAVHSFLGQKPHSDVPSWKSTKCGWQLRHFVIASSPCEKCIAAPCVLVKAERKKIEKEFTSLLNAKDFDLLCASRGIVYPVVDKAISHGPKGQTNYEVSNGVLRIKKEVAQKIPYVLTWVKTKGALEQLPLIVLEE